MVMHKLVGVEEFIPQCEIALKNPLVSFVSVHPTQENPSSPSEMAHYPNMYGSFTYGPYGPRYQPTPGSYPHGACRQHGAFFGHGACFQKESQGLATPLEVYENHLLCTNATLPSSTPFTRQQAIPSQNWASSASSFAHPGGAGVHVFPPQPSQISSQNPYAQLNPSLNPMAFRSSQRNHSQTLQSLDFAAGNRIASVP